MVARSPVPSVLIADAEYYICRVLEAKLSKDNQFRVVSATTGRDALDAAIAQSFDILLWDMRLRDTPTLLPRLRALCPLAVLFLMTTDDRPMLNAEINRLDVADVLVKPFGLDTLVEQLKQALAAPPSPFPAVIDLCRVGQQLTLLSESGQCVTRVLERAHDTFAVVGSPRVETPPDFAIGLRVRAQVKGQDALYSFETRLLREQPQPVPHWELRLPGTIRREQRRKYPRLAVTLPVRLATPDADSPDVTGSTVENGAADRTAAARGITEDISQGGFALVSEGALEVGTEIGFDLMQGSSVEITGRGRIVRTSAVGTPETEAERYRVAVQFTEIDPAARRQLRALLGPDS